MVGRINGVGLGLLDFSRWSELMGVRSERKGANAYRCRGGEHKWMWRIGWIGSCIVDFGMDGHS